MKHRRKRLNGTRVNGAASTVTSYPNLERRLAERDQLNLPLIESLALLGFNDKEIAKALEMRPQKFWRLKKKHVSIRTALKKGRVKASGDVVKSLYKTAIGFQMPEEKVIYSAKFDKITKVKTYRNVAPNAIAQMFWLKNHNPDFWKDKKEIEQTGPGAVGGAINNIKFVLVQPGKGGDEKEKVIDADFKVLPGAGNIGREKSE